MKNFKLDLDRYVKWIRRLECATNFKPSRANDRFYFGSKIYKQFVAETRAYAKKVSIYDWDKALRRSYDYVSCNVNLLHARILGV